METPEEKFKSEQGVFFLITLASGIAPYCLRLLSFSFNDVADFWMNEWDIFLFCIALSIASYAETVNIQKPLYYSTRIIQTSVVIFLFIVGAFLYTSINLEVTKLQLEAQKTAYLKSFFDHFFEPKTNSINTDNKALGKIDQLIDRNRIHKFRLFVISAICSAGILFVSKKVILRKQK